ncbi:hypothetical protein JD844_002840 [Phrynosoma platyrhinos]|uniref:Dynein light intermediate chain n=1 Tax=Phrynosoma platyrhinos TaxID=52577 RepID=A0ABQ7TCS5_PHRPL|nr:hypothetical protein JD844_002840 [Phrynosoma platyrhinos]
MFLGEDGAGKTSLIGKLQGIEEYKKGRGMEYLYLNVHDEDRDGKYQITTGVRTLNCLLKFAMEAISLKDTLVMLVVDMSKPWTALDSLQKWASVVREHIDKLKIPPEEMKEMEQKMVRDFQEYMEPGEDFPASPQRRNTSLQEDKDDSIILPLGADTLTCNLGIPVVVVCTKCDAISLLEKEHDYRDEHFDFIQSHIRRFCLQCILYYLNCFYIFSPAGWDNEKKIGILHENFQTLKVGDSFEDIITKPPVRKFVHEKEIVAEDDQVFLMKQQSLLAKQPPTAAGRPVDTSPRVPGGSPRTPNRSVTSNVASVTPIPAGSKKIDPSMKGKALYWALGSGADCAALEVEEDPFIGAHPKLVYDPVAQSYLMPVDPRTLQSRATTPHTSTIQVQVHRAASSEPPTPPPRAGATSEGVLANFFNSLLSKKTGSPGGPSGVGSPGGVGSTGGGSGSGLPASAKKSGQKPVLTDVQAELDRMSRKPDLVSPTTPTSPTEGEAS